MTTTKPCALVGFCAAVTSLLGCSSQSVPDEAATHLSQGQLMDPETCQGCHPKQYTEWSGSMHAYASDDPVFTAMNRRGQTETAGQLGTFCVQCHAPLAVATAKTGDGLNLDALPRKLRGVTCYFCHSVDSIDSAHNVNNPLHIAENGVFRGEYGDPAPNPAHLASYSKLHDRNQLESASLCGTCHDVVTTKGAHIERTFQEWRGSVFSQPSVGTTCGQCHMDQSTALEPIAQNVPGLTPRRTHSHKFAAVDTALTTFPENESQRAAVQTLLDSTLQSALCVREIGGGSQIVVILDNVASGHGFPSGSAQDRRLWAEVTAYAGDTLVYQSGVVPEGTPVTDLQDPDLWLLRDCMFDTKGSPVNMFWQAAQYDTNQLPAQLTFDKLDPRYYQTHVYKTYPGGSLSLPMAVDKVKLRMRLETVGLDVIRDLASQGDLDSAVSPPVVQVGKELVWTAATATEAFKVQGVIPATCITETNLSGAAFSVPAKLNCEAPAPADAGLAADGASSTDGTEQVSCSGDARVDAYAANLTKISPGGLQVAISQATPAPPAKGLNSWTMMISDQGGSPIDEDGITVTPFMPDHGHGTSAKVVVTQEGAGRYSFTPLYLFMPGVWRVAVTIPVGATSESVNFYFCIEG
jgi:hypothetical protein